MREMFEEYGRAVIAAIIAAGLFFVIGIYFTVTQTTPLWDALSAKNGMSISDTSGIAVDNRVPHIDIRNGGTSHTDIAGLVVVNKEFH